MTARPAAAAWVQDRFVIGAWGGGYGSPYASLYADSCEVRRMFKMASECHLNMLLFPTTGGDAPTLRSLLRMASAYGIRLVARGSPPRVITPGFLGVTTTSPEWAAFAGSFWGNVNSDEANFYTSTRGTDVERLHAGAPDKFVMTYTNKLAIIQQWFQATPSTQQMDAWSQQGQILANSAYSPYHSTALDQWIHNMATGFRPNWPSAYAMGNPDLPPADLVHLTEMGLWPAVLGSTGVVWWSWDAPSYLVSGYNDGQGTSVAKHPPDLEGYIVTRQGRWIARINRYLEDYIGPAVMRSQYLGIYHDTCEVGEPWVYCSSATTSLPREDRPLVYRLGSNTTVAVDSSRDESPRTYYLLVTNRSEAPISTTVSLKGTTWLTVAAAPSVNSYSAYSGYALQDTTRSLRAPSFAENHITSFSVGLTPGEVRIFRVVPDAQDVHAARLISPIGAESWLPGESRTVKWTGITSNATVRLYTDQVVGSGMIGPYVELAAGVSGTSATITVPDVVTARGRIVVTGTGPDHGPLVTATHQLPLRVGRETSAQVLRTNLLATYGYAFSSLVHTPAGPQVLAMGDTSGWLRQLQPGTAGRWTNTIVGDCNNCADPSAPLLMYGKAVSATTGASGDIHAAYFSLFHLSAPVNDPHCAVCAGQGLRYQHFANGAWSREGVDIMGTTHGDCGIALDGAGTVHIAYNAGAWNNHTLRIRKRVNGAWVNAVRDLNSFPGRPPIDPHEIQLGLATGGYFAGGMYVSFINRWTGTEQVYMEDGADWVEVLRQYGADGQSAMDVDANGYARVVYTTRGSTPGSHRLWFRQMVFNRTTSFLGFMPPELIDSTALAVEDVRLAHADQVPVVAYAANGALVYRVRKSPGVWNREVIELSHDVGGPIGLDQMPDGERRFTYRDAADDQLRYITIPSGSVGVGDGDGAPRRDTATLVSQNPLIRGGRLRFELDLRGPAALELALFDLAGRRVASRRDPAAPAGRRALEWGPGNQAPGVYFVRVLVGGRVALSRRLVLI